ncbi:hypothetical protein OSB04_016274 [Centaurea solstitialis]|uniref:Uncharacterized protein n=1 Tax=Centaurea solstitialis TaxID=347529 RepID=A0AA38WJJ4_9ASTR|nr:hypothetical protein OSB04_016274 [Centaurea solstitialis]
MKRLKWFHLGNCVAIQKLPEELGRLECLKVLFIGGTSVRRLPQSIFELKASRPTYAHPIHQLLSKLNFISKSKLRVEDIEDWNHTFEVRIVILNHWLAGDIKIGQVNEDGTKIEYGVWNPFKSNSAAAVLDSTSRYGVYHVIFERDHVCLVGACGVPKEHQKKQKTSL